MTATAIPLVSTTSSFDDSNFLLTVMGFGVGIVPTNHIYPDSRWVSVLCRLSLADFLLILLLNPVTSLKATGQVGGMRPLTGPSTCQGASRFQEW